MRLSSQWVSMLVLYALGAVLLCWSVFIFFYQYIAALTMPGSVLQAFVTPRILSALWISITSSFATAFLSIIFGVPLAYLFAIKNCYCDELRSYLGTILSGINKLDKVH